MVGCTKGHVAKVYKALAAATLPGGKLAGLAKLPPVKQSICLSLPPQIACSIIRKELESTLLRRGWAAFTDDMLLGVLLHTKDIRLKACNLRMTAVFQRTPQATASFQQPRGRSGSASLSS